MTDKLVGVAFNQSGDAAGASFVNSDSEGADCVMGFVTLRDVDGNLVTVHASALPRMDQQNVVAQLRETERVRDQWCAAYTKLRDAFQAAEKDRAAPARNCTSSQD